MGPESPDHEPPVGLGSSERRRTVVSRALEEVDREVARRRDSGDVPTGYEEALDRGFSDLTPSPGRGSQGLLRSVAVVEESALIDLQVPVASRQPAGSLAKRLIRAAVGWYVRFFVSQISRFALAVARALNLVAEDLESLHRTVSALRPPVPTDAMPKSPEDRWWSADALSALSGAKGPVLHAECGAGGLLRALRGAGIDGYGLDPARADASSPPELDVRTEPLVDHLRLLPPGSLGGAVLEGSVQWLGPTASGELVALLATRIGRSGTLVVASLTPEAWARSGDPVLTDLAPNRPLHPETWSYILTHNGFRDVEINRGGEDLRTVLRSGSSASPGERALSAVVEKIVAGPDEYVVTAVCEGLA